MSDQKYSIDEIRRYILSQDSMGDVLYNLKPDKIAEANQPKMFRISGYWKDDLDEFEDYLVVSDDYHKGTPVSEDEKIFFYGLNEEDIKQMIEDGEETGEDFVITGYSIDSY